MIGFIIPIKPKRFSKDWGKDSRLLDRTLKSIVEQTDPNFRVYIVYNDKPETSFFHKSLNWIYFDHEFVETSNIADYNSYGKRWYNPDYASKMFDKGRKITLGTKYAIDSGCDYIMAIDSDDLISNKIAEFVNNQRKDCPGWVIRKGYMYLEGTKFILINKEIQNINGSTHIINQRLISIPPFTSLNQVDFNFFESHGYLYQRLINEKNTRLATLPFIGIIYVVHNNNSSDIHSILSLRKAKTFAKILVYGHILTKKIRNEFGLYRLIV